MIVELNGLALDVSLLAWRNGTWLELALTETDRGLHSKLEISRGQSSCLKKRANHDRKIIKHQRYGLLRCTS